MKNLESAKNYWQNSQKQIEILQHKRINDTNHICETAFKQLVAELKNFKITKVTFQFKCWFVEGDTFVAVNIENPEIKYSLNLNQILHWASYCFDPHYHFFWKPETIDANEIFALQNLTLLCNWWAENTGGISLDLTPNLDEQSDS
jgi:hypothetical protein